MGKIIYTGISRDDAARLYGDWLMDRLPAAGAFIGAGPHAYALPALPALPASFAETKTPDGRLVRSTVDGDRTDYALRCFREWRRLPAGIAVGATNEGYTILESGSLALPDGEILTFPGILDAVLTDKETAALYGCTAGKVQKDCENGGFRWDEARKEGPTWLLTRAAAARRYGNEPETTPPISPLLLVMTTAYAGTIWGRSAEEVRSAAAGAGHRAARLGDGERRRAGRTWLVTREAMEKLYGNMVPGEWKLRIKNEE